MLWGHDKINIMKKTTITTNTTLTAAVNLAATANNARPITDKLFNEAFVKASRRAMMKQDKAVNILGLAAYTEDGQMEFVKQELAEMRLTRSDLLDVKPMTLPTGDLAEDMARATEDFMVINYGKSNADVLNIRKYVLLKVKHDGANTRVFAAYLVKEEGKLVKRFMDIVTMEKVKESDIPSDVVTYAMIGSTAAGSRTGSVYYYKQGIEIDSILNFLSYGAWNKMVNKKGHVSVANKNLVRIFAGFSSNVNGGEVRDYAIYFGDMATLQDNGKPQDGMLYNSLDLAVSATSALLGVDVPAKVAHKFAGQVRPFTTKCFSKTVSRKEMRTIMDSLAGGRNNIIVLQREDITADVEKELDLSFKGKGAYAGKLVVVGDINKVQILSDTNGYKAPFDYKLVSEFTILDLPTDTSAKTSIQLIEKLLVADLEKTERLLSELITEQCGAEIQALAKLETKIPSLKEAEAGYVHGLTKSINPDYVTADRRMYLAEIKDTKTRIEKMLNKMKFAVDGLNARIHADYATMFGKRFIMPNEVLVASRVVKRLAEEDITNIIGIKYPSVGLKEFLKATPISCKTLEDRVRADLDLTADQKETLISMYRNTNDGVAVIGAYNALKDKLAGLDFDYDMICFFFDKRIADILVGLPEEMVVFDESAAPVRKAPKDASNDFAADFGFNFSASVKAVKSKADAQQSLNKEEVVTNELDLKEQMVELEITFNKDSAHNAFCMFFSFTGVNVGAITNNGLTHDLALLRTPVMQAMVTKAFGPAPKHARAYKGLVSELFEMAPGHVVEKYTINGAIAEQLEAEMKSCARDEDSLIKIFKDLNVVYRYYQELAIDAAKTFIAPMLNLELARGFKPAILKPATFESPEVEINFDSFEADYAIGKLKKVYVFNDPLNNLRCNALKSLKGAFDQLASQEFTSPEGLKEYWESKLTDQAQIEGLNYIATLYTRVAAHYSQLTATLEANSPLRAAYNKEKRFYFNALRNMFIAITPGMSDQMRGSLAKMLNYFVASEVKGANRYIIKERTNREGSVSPIAFAESVLGYEYFANVCKSQSSVPFAGERIVSGDVEVGRTVTFVDGIFTDETSAAATVVKINGEFEIIENNGVKYAVKPILDVVEAPVKTNHILCEIKSSAANKESYDFIKAVKREGLEVGVDGYKVNVAGVDYSTTLCGAVKRVAQSSGVIESVLPTYVYNEDGSEKTLRGIYAVIAVEDLTDYVAPVKTEKVTNEEESLEVLRARALAKLNGEEAEEAVGTPIALQTSLSLDDDFELDASVDVEVSPSNTITPATIVAGSFDLDEIEL